MNSDMEFEIVITCGEGIMLFHGRTDDLSIDEVPPGLEDYENDPRLLIMMAPAQEGAAQ